MESEHHPMIASPPLMNSMTRFFLFLDIPLLGFFNFRLSEMGFWGFCYGCSVIEWRCLVMGGGGLLFWRLLFMTKIVCLQMYWLLIFFHPQILHELIIISKQPRLVWLVFLFLFYLKMFILETFCSQIACIVLIRIVQPHMRKPFSMLSVIWCPTTEMIMLLLSCTPRYLKTDHLNFLQAVFARLFFCLRTCIWKMTWNLTFPLKQEWG